MPEAGLPWTALSASRERRFWLRSASAACILVAVALAGGLAAGHGWSHGVAIGIALLAGAVAWHAGNDGAPGWELRIDADGAVWVRPRGRAPADGASAASYARSDLSLRAIPVHVSVRLATLRTAHGVLAVWRDSLPREAFRRLACHARWHVERTGAPTPTLPPGGPLAH